MADAMGLFDVRRLKANHGVMTEFVAKTIEDSRHLRNALGRFATGIAVITTQTQSGKLEGLTVNSFSAVSLDPPLVLWSLQKRAHSRQNFHDAGRFAVNILGLSQRSVSRSFSTSSMNKFQDISFEIGAGGCPLLSGSLAIFECATRSVVEGGDHLIFIGSVEAFSYRDGEPLVFSAGSLCSLAPLPREANGPREAAMADLEFCA